MGCLFVECCSVIPTLLGANEMLKVLRRASSNSIDELAKVSVLASTFY